MKAFFLQISFIVERFFVLEHPACNAMQCDMGGPIEELAYWSLVASKSGDADKSGDTDKSGAGRRGREW